MNIIAKDLCIAFQVRLPGHYSIKHKVLKSIVGGRLNNGSQSSVIGTAIVNANFELSSGDRVGLFGHNGAGKSTLLRAIAGIYAPISGSLIVGGNVTSLLDISIGMDPDATGIENILMRGVIMGYKLDFVRSKLSQISSFTDLGDYLHLPLRSYSSGMQMRLAFAVSTAFEPEILLMDEWLSVGDAEFMKKCEHKLSELLEVTKIMVLASHSKELLRKTCNRILLLDHGTVREVSIDRL